MQRWDIFCRVVDNYGDIGVCWRLARQLQHAHQKQVRLWVDDLASFHRIWPAIDPGLPEQSCESVLVRRWQEPFPVPITVADVVIEAFACELPATYVDGIRAARPRWLNLEYLSAEPWVKEYHLGHSPLHGVPKTFFFPGFEPGTGGLLWDESLLGMAVQGADQSPKARLWSRLDIADLNPEAIQISLFAYQNPALPGLLEALAAYPRPITLLVPPGLACEGLAAWLDSPVEPGRRHSINQLTILVLPFLTQIEYDELLAACDFNFVRGEDSFVRSQMLARPFVWHIYPQEDAVHQVKLAAFLDLFLAGSSTRLASAIREAHACWNQSAPCGPEVWSTLLDQLPAMRQYAGRWQQQLVSLGDLASNLVHFDADQV